MPISPRNWPMASVSTKAVSGNSAGISRRNGETRMTFMSTSNGVRKIARGRDCHHVSAFSLIPRLPKKNGAGKLDKSKTSAPGNALQTPGPRLERAHEQEAEVGSRLT